MGVFHRRHVWVMVVAAAAFLLPGWSSGVRPVPGAHAVPPAATAMTQAATVTVTEHEFSIAVSPTALTAGTYMFDVQNKGTIPHNLTIKGPGVNRVLVPVVVPGRSVKVAVALRKGAYELWCGIDAHKVAGMDTVIQVR